MNLANSKKGFGVIETLIACTILALLAGALLSLSVLIVKSISKSRHQVQAYNLASQAIETVRQIRDTNLIDGKEATKWNSFVCSGTSTMVPEKSGQIYKISTDHSCDSVSEPRFFLLFDPAGEKLDPDSNRGAGQQRYTRKISFEPSGVSPIVGDANSTENNAIRVKVEVSWGNSDREKIEVRELLTNWKQGY